MGSEVTPAATASLIPVPSALAGILLDVDGTLYIQSKVRRRMLLRLIRNLARHPVTGARTARFLRAYRTNQERLRDVPSAADQDMQLTLTCQRLGLTEDDGRAIVRRWMELMPLDVIANSITPGLKAFLEAAAEQGIRCGIVSDYPAEDKLNALGIRHYFSAVVSPGVHSVGRLKPAPDGILAALDLLGLSRHNTVYVGDRGEVDAEAAKRAGVPAILIGPRPHSKYHVPVVRNFFELRARLLTRPETPM